MKIGVAMALMALCGAAEAEVAFDRGAWKVAFDEAGAKLRLECPARKVSVEGRFSFVSDGRAWNVVESRDAAGDRLALVKGGVNGTVLGYVSFRALGERLEMIVLHRAGANFFPGVLSFGGIADFRADSFPCRTIPATGERVLGFADGIGDSTCNDAVFAREEDLALRFFSCATAVASKGEGRYGVRLEADVDDPAKATLAIEVDGAYYASRWAPGYHPIDRTRCPRALTGWMSWNTYFDKAGYAENLAEARST